MWRILARPSGTGKPKGREGRSTVAKAMSDEMVDQGRMTSRESDIGN